MIIYKDILKQLGERGWTSYRLKAEKQLAGSTIDRIREGRPITTETIDTVCRLCECQPGDLIYYAADDEGREG